MSIKELERGILPHDYRLNQWSAFSMSSLILVLNVGLI